MAKRDMTQYIFSRNVYAKRRLVEAVVSDYIQRHKDSITYATLVSIFPDKIQHCTQTGFKNGVVSIVDTIKTADADRFFPEQYELADGKKVRICNGWDKDNIQAFIECAKQLGYHIESVTA